MDNYEYKLTSIQRNVIMTALERQKNYYEKKLISGELMGSDYHFFNEQWEQTRLLYEMMLGETNER